MDNSNEEEWTSRRKQFRKRQWLKHRQRQKISRQSSPVSPVSTDSLALGSNSSLVESVLPPSQFHKRQWLKNSQRQNIPRLLLPLPSPGLPVSADSPVSTESLALGSNTSHVESVLPPSQFHKRQWLKHRQRKNIPRLLLPLPSPVPPVSTDSLALGSNSSLVESVLPNSQFHKRQWLKNSQRQNISRLLLPLTESSVSTDFLALGSNTSLVEPVLPISQKGRVTDSLGLGRNASLVESVLPDSHVAPDSELKQRRKQFHQWEWLNLFKRV